MNIVNRNNNKKLKKQRKRKAIVKPKNNNHLLRGLDHPFPQEKMIVVITTSDGAAQAAAAPFAVIEARLADPTNSGFSGGSGAFVVATAGILDMAAYALARVKTATVMVSGTSNDPGAVCAISLIFSDTQPSTVITTFALAKAAQIGYLSTPVRKIAVSTGNSAFQIPPITLTARQVIGDIMPYSDRDFVTTVNPAHSAPVQEWWTACVVTSVNAATNLTNGLDLSITVTSRVEAASRLIGT